MSKLLLIDGNAMIHRAYHAYPSLTNTNGDVVNAVYGFFTMLLLVMKEQSPDYLAVCFDRPGPTIRQAMYAGYHAHRPEMPDDFVPQIVLIHELLETMKVCVFEKDGYEGDDLIGTIVRLAVSIRGPVTTFPPVSARSGLASSKELRAVGSPSSRATPALERIEVVILTGDRDLLQLVTPQVKVLMPIVGITKTVLFDEQAVEAKYGVKPSQFVDYKALIGDASDGYPGVSGIGPKTSSKLITQYGTFENLYKHLEDLPEKLALKLATDAEQAALAKKLATIITDVSTPFDLHACSCSHFDSAALRSEFVSHGFKTLTKRLDDFFGVPKERKDEQLELL